MQTPARPSSRMPTAAGYAAMLGFSLVAGVGFICIDLLTNKMCIRDRRQAVQFAHAGVIEEIEKNIDYMRLPAGAAKTEE